MGIYGVSHGPKGHGVLGENMDPTSRPNSPSRNDGVRGSTLSYGFDRVDHSGNRIPWTQWEGPGAGVVGYNRGSGHGVVGFSTFGDGILGRAGEFEGKNGIHGESSSPDDSGVWGESLGQGYGVTGTTSSSKLISKDNLPSASIFGKNYGAGPGVIGVSSQGDGVIARVAGTVYMVTLQVQPTVACGVKTIMAAMV